MTETNVRATFSDNYGVRIIMIGIEQSGMQSCGFMYDIEQAKNLQRQLDVCILSWEESAKEWDRATREHAEVSSNG